MTAHRFPITLYPSLYRIDTYTPAELTWLDVIELFSEHVEVLNKDRAKGFGPYQLTNPEHACLDHKDQTPRSTPHRCDSCVTRLTMAVFDADMGTQEDITRCDDLLETQGILRLWYTSYSYSATGAESWRLIIPLSKPVPAPQWESFRASVIKKFSIPADVKKCSGTSHFYYGPSVPKGASRQPVVFHGGSTLLDPNSVPHFAPTPDRYRVKLAPSSTWEPPEDPDELPDLGPHRERLVRRMHSLKDEQKRLWLQRALDGHALDTKGNRTQAMLVTSGVIVRALPPRTPLVVFLELLTPSLVQMQDEGSKLTEERLRTMLIPAMRKRDLVEQQYKEQQAVTRKVINAVFESVRKKGSAVPTLTTLPKRS
jgi:hypothetical protein